MWRDHQTAQLVNELRDCAIKYHAAGQLQERIAYVVVPVCQDLTAAQQEIARLRAALSALELSANTVARCYTHRPENFAAALQSLEDDAAAARETLNK